MFFFILNPVAGNGRAVSVMENIKNIFDEAHAEYIVVQSEYPRHATKLAGDAAKSGYQNIVAVGGDGTVLEVVTGLTGHDCSFGIIPAGTGNDFVKSLGMKNDPALAASVILAKRTKFVDVGSTSQNRYFMNVAGTGFDVEVIRFTEKFKKVLRGITAYTAAVFVSLLTYKTKTLTFKTENGTFVQDIFLVAIANGMSYGGGMKVAPNAVPDDGFFDVTIVDKMPKLLVPFILPRFISGHHDNIKQLKSFKCKSIEISTNEPAPINMDGELIGDTPMKFEIKHNLLRVFVP